MRPEPGHPGDSGAFADNVWGYHALNLAIHLAAALALFGIVGRTLRSAPLAQAFGGASTPLAFVVALVWTVHPLQTESVTYVVQRVESLMGLFYLLTLYCAIRAAEGGGRWTAAAIGACALGMGTKEVMVTAPLMVWLWDRTFLGGAPRSRWPLYAGLAATWLVLAALMAAPSQARTVLGLLAGSSAAGPSIGPGEQWAPWSYMLTQATVVVHYLRLALLPSPLVFDYYDWPQARSLGDVWPQAALLDALAIGTLVAIVRGHPIGFAGAWFFAILAPTSSFIPNPDRGGGRASPVSPPGGGRRGGRHRLVRAGEAGHPARR